MKRPRCRTCHAKLQTPPEVRNMRCSSCEVRQRVDYLEVRLRLFALLVVSGILVGAAFFIGWLARVL
jgi:thiosulfate reductase cytochrome b subunit